MALVPEGVKALKKLGVDVLIEAGAGVEAGFTDQSYTSKKKCNVEFYLSSLIILKFEYFLEIFATHTYYDDKIQLSTIR